MRLCRVGSAAFTAKPRMMRYMCDIGGRLQSEQPSSEPFNQSFATTHCRKDWLQDGWTRGRDYTLSANKQHRPGWSLWHASPYRLSPAAAVNRSVTVGGRMIHDRSRIKVAISMSSVGRRQIIDLRTVVCGLHFGRRDGDACCLIRTTRCDDVSPRHLEFVNDISQSQTIKPQYMLRPSRVTDSATAVIIIIKAWSGQ